MEAAKNAAEHLLAVVTKEVTKVGLEVSKLLLELYQKVTEPKKKKNEGAGSGEIQMGLNKNLAIAVLLGVSVYLIRKRSSGDDPGSDHVNNLVVNFGEIKLGADVVGGGRGPVPAAGAEEQPAVVVEPPVLNRTG